MKFKAKKVVMSQIFDSGGNVIPVTVLKIVSPSLKENDLAGLLDAKVELRGISKGKGFQGVMKRWGFSGHPATHGHFAVQRHPGSIGAQGEGRVMPFKKMPGRMGGDKVCVKGLKIVAVSGNTLSVSGPVPGHRGGIVEITVDNIKVQNPNVKKSSNA